MGRSESSLHQKLVGLNTQTKVFQPAADPSVTSLLVVNPAPFCQCCQMVPGTRLNGWLLGSSGAGQARLPSPVWVGHF